MTAVFALLTWLIFGFAALISAAPTSEGLEAAFNTTEVASYDPSIEYHGYATAEIWMGHLRTNIGDLTGADLYLKMYEQLQNNCYGGRPGCTFSGEGKIPTHFIHSTDKVAESKSSLHGNTQEAN